jgi:hypothetical protein
LQNNGLRNVAVLRLYDEEDVVSAGEVVFEGFQRQFVETSSRISPAPSAATIASDRRIVVHLNVKTASAQRRANLSVIE